MDYPTFLATFPEFGNPVEFPQARVNFWIGVATNMINQWRWGTMYTFGLTLLIAHYLVLDSQNQTAFKDNVIPGEVTGITTDTSVDAVSVSYDVGNITLSGAGMFNRTSYGIQFWQLAKWKGSGPRSALSSAYWD